MKANLWCEGVAIFSKASKSNMLCSQYLTAIVNDMFQAKLPKIGLQRGYNGWTKESQMIKNSDIKFINSYFC